MKKYTILSLISFIIVVSVVNCGKSMLPVNTNRIPIRPDDSALFDLFFVEGVKQKLLGNSGEALGYLERCVKINPESDAAYFQMAQIAFSVGNRSKGKIYSKKASSLDPDNIWYMMILASNYFEENKLDSAIYYYEQASEKFPEKEELLLTLGNLYTENRKYDKAEKIFSDLDAKYGINETSTTANIRNMIMAEKYNEALKLAEQLLMQNPDEILYNGLLAEIYRGLGESNKAMEVYNKLIERNPDNPEIQLAMVDFLINEKRFDELFLFLNSVLINQRVNRQDKITLMAQLIEIPEVVEEKYNQLELSLMILEADYRNDDIVILLLPELYIKQNKLDKAASRLEEIIAEKPENYYAWEKLLLVYLQDGNYKKLQEKGEKAASMFNRSFLAKILYASGATENRDYDIALEELRKAEILAGDNKEMLMQIYSLKADIYYRQKYYDKAFETFDVALQTDNSDITILNNYAYYLAEQDMRLKEAEKMAKQVIEREKENTTFLDTYAWVLYKRGKLKEAERIMQNVMESGDKPDAEWYEHMGFIQMKRKNCENAVVNWNIAVKLDSTKTNLLDEIKKCEGSR